MGEQSERKQRQPAVITRQQILATASLLFYTQGIRAVGMDAIVRELGIGTMTLYRQFPTKDDLVVACVQMQSQAWWERFGAAQAAAPADASAQLMALFVMLAHDVAAPGFRGCPFLNTITEFPDPTHPAHIAALAHKQRVREHLQEGALRAGSSDPRALADALVVVMDGVYASAQAFGPIGPAQGAKGIAQTLIDAQLA